jgi:hypothetical protein
MEDATHDRLVGDDFDAATAHSVLLADLIGMLVQKGVLADHDARELLFRSEGIIRFMPAASLQREAYNAVAGRLRERLGWHSETATLHSTPLPPEDDPAQP